jgi:hypothetical protein
MTCIGSLRNFACEYQNGYSVTRRVREVSQVNLLHCRIMRLRTDVIMFPVLTDYERREPLIGSACLGTRQDVAVRNDRSLWPDLPQYRG